MSLRLRLETHPETILDLARASRARYEEGLSLIAQGKRWTGIYIAGYAVEMILKIAYFLAKGAIFTDHVKPELDATRVAARLLGIQHSPEGFHSVLFWTDLLLAECEHKGRSLPASLKSELHIQTDLLYDYWWIGMRYRPYQGTREEARILVDSVGWFMCNRAQLWRQR